MPTQPADPYECADCLFRCPTLYLCTVHRGRLGIQFSRSPAVVDVLRARLELPPRTVDPDPHAEYVPAAPSSQPAIQPHRPQHTGPVPPPPPPSIQPEPADEPDLLDTLRF